MGRYSSISSEKTNGIVYTPADMAESLANMMVENVEIDRNRVYKILDPALGTGQLLLALISQLVRRGVEPVNIQAFAFETDGTVLSNAIMTIQSRFSDVVVNVYNQDFVSTVLNDSNQQRVSIYKSIDLLIANPPYIRTQILGSDKAQYLSQQLDLTGRVDLAYAFIKLADRFLTNTGIAGFITSNKFMSIKSGKRIREFLRVHTNLLKVVDFGDTKLFKAAVFPCFIIFQKGPAQAHEVPFVSIYETHVDNKRKKAGDIFSGLAQHSVVGTNDNKDYQIKYGILAADSNSAVWRVATKESDKWLGAIRKKTWKLFSDIGKIRVGIKTTADNVFIGDQWGTLPKEEYPELLKPLITHRNAGQIVANDKPLWQVLYTHESVNGKRQAIDLSKYPRSLRYLNRHRSQLEARKYIKEAKRNWYEIWVPHDPGSWKDKKIVFRDISEQPQFWLDISGAVVNGDCYWLDVKADVEEEILFLALAVANSSFIERFYDEKFNNKLYGKKRRYMSQYVEQFPIPNPGEAKSQLAIEIVRKINLLKQIDEDNKQIFCDLKLQLDELIWDLFS